MLLGKYKRLIFIGDSNSDNGNVFQMTSETHPQPEQVYWKGRYSNGKTWTDHLEGFSGAKAINLAFGCATIDNSLVSGTVPMPDKTRCEVPGVLDQIERLRDMVGHLHPDELVFIQAGSNDLNSLVYPGPTYRRKQPFTPEILARRLVAGVRTLCVDMHARNVVVMNVRAREQYPGIIATNDPTVIQKSLLDTESLNSAIEKEIGRLQAELGDQFLLSVFDTHGFQRRIAESPAAFGISADWPMPMFRASQDNPQTSQIRLADPETRMFVDEAHLGRRAQALLAADVVKELATALAISDAGYQPR
ncbi:hypothetical protein LPJ56_000227 [Coemansia sp. RSA 2599]|nr:hypothetical protein LPJ75_001564 [Coemansia sp. RSA 2598]KAJ1829578.1 hypothetical protein LPJ56_000227 [Coemansia sp. RSA 2599]